ncbi:carbonic anhydrase 14 isoform X2 [Mycteria americana]|uniref:carbonic anhydrase 14 isoform X2 n=1 Tax=Mycteria americana TaxID=33587 RepID=UPI003F58CFBA
MSPVASFGGKRGRFGSRAPLLGISSPKAGGVPPPGPHGQQHWPEGHPACGGRAQSPIDIRTQRVQPDPSLPPIRPVGYRRPGTPAFTLANNGHTAVLALPPSLRLQGLPRSFAAAQLHFHWGRPGRTGGAEHLLDGRRAPAEMHVVHYDAERYANASEAQHHAGGLAVLGVLLEVGADPHPAYDNILSHLGSVRYAGQTTAVPSFSLQDLLPPRLDLYYRYNGSLTTPPCFQSVLWTLFQQPVRISLAQLEQLQGTLYATEAAEPQPQRLVDNFRVPQELNQRLVRSSFPRGPEGYSTASSSPSTLWPRGCERGGRRSRTSCSKPPPAAPPRTMAPTLEPPPGQAVTDPRCPPALCPCQRSRPTLSPTAAAAPAPVPLEIKSLPRPTALVALCWGGGDGDGAICRGASGPDPVSPEKPGHAGCSPRSSDRGWEQSKMGGTDPSPRHTPHPVPSTEVASGPWYPSLY